MKSAVLKSVAIAIAALTVSSADARMGETIVQCDQRYGAPKRTSPDGFELLAGPGVTHRVYAHHGWNIRTAFIGGRAALLRYSKINGQTIQNDEVQAILKAESLGGTWDQKCQFSLNPIRQLRNTMTMPRLWTNGIGAKAYFDNPMFLSFIIEAPVVEKYKKAKAEAAERQRKSNIPDF